MEMTESESIPLTSKDQPESRQRKLMKTLWLFWAMTLVGFNNGILGPTILDLIKLIGKDNDFMQYIFVGQGAGFMLGIGLGALISKRISLTIVISFSLLLGSLSNVIIPWMANCYAMVFIFLVQGLSKGILEIGAFAYCGFIWPENNGLQFQFITTGVSLAAFIGPFLVTPFLSMALPISSTYSTLSGVRYPANDTKLPPDTICNVGSTSQQFGREMSPVCAPETSLTFLPYTIVAVIVLPAAIAFLYYYRQDRAREMSCQDEDVKAAVVDEVRCVEEYGSPAGRKLMLILLFLFHLPIAGFYLAYSDLLTPFGVTSALRLSPSRMALMTSTFWGCFLLGRLLTTTFSKCLGQLSLMAVNSAGLLASSMLLVFTGSMFEQTLWMGTAMMSLFNSPFLPGMIAWISAYIPISGSLIPICLMGAAVGELIVPFAAGALFTTLGPMSLMYTVLVLVVIQLGLFMAIWIAKKVLLKP